MSNKEKDDFPLEYTYDKLAQILKEATTKAKAGKLDLEGKLFGVAAGYAQDFVDTSKAIRKPLDLTGRTEDNIFLCLTRVCAENQARNMSTAENKTDMTKKFGYYQLFSLVNSMNCEGRAIEIAVENNPILSQPKLVIKSLPDRNGKAYTFDVLAAAKSTIDKLTILDPKTDGAILFGQLAPFYQQLGNDLLSHLRKNNT